MENVIAPPTPTEIVIQADSGTIAVESILRRQIEKRDEIKKTIKTHRESLKNLLTNDLDYGAAEELVKDNTKDLKTHKQRVLNTGEALQIGMKIKEQQEMLKDLDQSINNHYATFEHVTGQLTLCDIDGTPLVEAKKVYRLKKAKKRKDA